MILSIHGIYKSFGADQVLNNISFVLNQGQHMGLVGANGVGKSTLLRIIIGEMEPDRGEIAISRGIDIGYLAQTVTGLGDKTVEELIYDSQGNLRQLDAQMRSLEARMNIAKGSDLAGTLGEYSDLVSRFETRGGYQIDYKIDLVLHGLQLAHIPRDRKVVTLSGGEKARLGLATLLLRSPDLLLLDEPTNHLDFLALEWLGNYLQSHKSALLMVSHDRRFLNQTADTLLEIVEHSRELRQYTGNYEAYLAAKAIDRAIWEKSYEDQQEEIKQLRQAVRIKARQVGHNRPARDADKVTHKFFGERVQKTVSRNIRSAEERLERIEENPIPRPPEPLRISPEFDPQVLETRTPLLVSGVSKSFGSKVVLDDINFALSPSDHIVLIGPNGAGKSVLLKILAGKEMPDAGEVIVGSKVKIGYLDQEQESLNLKETLFEAYSRNLTGHEEELNANLFRYRLFLYGDLHKRIGELSIGQRRKLQIARLLAERANLLLLDEPTNHIALDVLEDFDQALRAFPGPILSVSHDRWFIERFANKVWELRDHRLYEYSGGLESYLTSLKDNQGVLFRC